MNTIARRPPADPVSSLVGRDEAVARVLAGVQPPYVDALALTPTEARVARLAGDGLLTRDVAAELGISPRTVETHLASLYGKLGVSSRAELGRVMALRETNEPPPGFHG